jgi:hypothetical protein
VQAFTASRIPRPSTFGTRPYSETAEKVPHQAVRRHAAARLEHLFAISHGSIAAQEVVAIELTEKLLSDDVG